MKKIGIVGLGKMGMLHLEKLIQNPRVVLSGVWDLDSQKLESVEKRLKIKSFPDVETLFFDSDAVVIATPTPTHFHLAQRALQHDLHVFLEKPIAQSLLEGQELVRLAHKKNKVLQTGFLERYRWMRLKQATPDLWSLPPRIIFAERSSSEPSRDPQADIVTDLMIHDIDFVLWTLGKKPHSVQAEGMSVRGTSLDLAYAKLEFESGEVAHLKAQWVAPQRVRSAQLFWEKTRIHFDLLTQKVNRADFLQDGSIQDVESQVGGPDPLTDQLNSFVLAVQGEEPVLVDGHHGCLAQEICEAIKFSIENKPQKKSVSLEFEGEYVN